MVNSVGYVLRFLAKLCRSLLCDDLFSHQPFSKGSSGSEEAQEKKEGRMESGRLCLSVFPVPEVVPSVPAFLGDEGSQAASLPSPTLGELRHGQDTGYLDSSHSGCSGKRLPQLLRADIIAFRLMLLEFR